MHFLQAINCDIGVLIVCNKTGGTIKGDIKKPTTNCQLKDIRWDGLIHEEFPQTVSVVCFSFPKSLFIITIPYQIYVHIFCFH